MSDDSEGDVITLDDTDETGDEVVTVDVESSDAYDLQTQTYGFTNLVNSSVDITVGPSGRTTIIAHPLPSPAGANTSAIRTNRRDTSRATRGAKRSRFRLTSESPVRESPKRPNRDPSTSTDNDSVCIICLEPFENYGEHR